MRLSSVHKWALTFRHQRHEVGSIIELFAPRKWFATNLFDGVGNAQFHEFCAIFERTIADRGGDRGKDDFGEVRLAYEGVCRNAFDTTTYHKLVIADVRPQGRYHVRLLKRTFFEHDMVDWELYNKKLNFLKKRYKNNKIRHFLLNLPRNKKKENNKIK